MKGIIVAGGLGTRLHPLTKIVNKHLLPVYHRPMISYPLDTLARSGIRDILIVTSKGAVDAFMRFLGDEMAQGIKLSYAVQEKDDGGIADAVRYGEDFAAGDHVAVILGDNIFEHHFADAVGAFKKGAVSFFKKVSDPRRFGAPVFTRDGKTVARIEEKPSHPKSPYAHTGFYLFDGRIFDIIKTLRPSARGQLEIVDATNAYIAMNEHDFRLVHGFWSDAGTFESLMQSSRWAEKRASPKRPKKKIDLLIK